MRTGGTILALAIVVALCLRLRARWLQLSRRQQIRWLLLATLGILSRSLTDAIRWELAASRLNDLLLWFRISGYILLVILFTRLRPRRATVLTAVVLLLPLFSATVYLPLELVFDPTPRRLTHLGDRVVFEQTSWERKGNDNRAVDYTVSRRARWLPFLQRNYRVGRLYRTQCDTDAITASLPTPDLVVLHCPSGAPGEPPLDEDVPLRGNPDHAPKAVVGSKP